MKQLQISIPNFYGFYESPLDISNYIDAEDTYNYDDINWNEVNKKVSEKYFDLWKDQNEELLNDLSINIVYSHLDSPKFYNYRTDELICEITFDLEVFKNKVLGLVNESLESFKDFIKEKYSSRSGFHSFYPNDCEVWMTEYLTDENIDNVIVEGYLEFLQDDDMDSLIYEVIDNSYELINY